MKTTMKTTSMNKRKKIALALYIFLIFATIWDVFFTYLFSPNLENEGNIIVIYFGYTWTSALIIKATALVLGALFCHRLYIHDYTKPSTSEKFNQKLFNMPLKTPEKRYVFEFSSMLGVSLACIIGGSTWIIKNAIEYEGSLYQQFLSIELLGIPFIYIFICCTVFPIGTFIGNKVVNYYLPELALK